MEQENATTLYFYPSKVKNFLFIIIGIFFVVGGAALCYGAFLNGDYFMSLLGAGLAGFFGFSIFIFSKKIINPAPYLLLTEKELIINPNAKHVIPIKWEDIEGYRMIAVSHPRQRFIEIVLYDEEKYEEQMPEVQQKLSIVGTMGGKYSLFAIGLANVKRKEHDLLFYALDYIQTPSFDINEATSGKTLSKTTYKFTDEINAKYFKKAYIISFFLAIFTMFLLYKNDPSFFVIISFIIFPFAKLIFDVVLGFKMKKIVEQQSKEIYYLYQLIIYSIYLLLFIFGLFIAPIGILFLVARALSKFANKFL